GREAREDVVMDTLWPDAEGDLARTALNSAVYRLRRLLGHEAAVVRQSGVLGLDARLCWVDAWAVDRLLGHADAPSEERVRRALDLHLGTFLEGEDSELPQAAALAEGLRRRLLRHAVRIGRQHEGTDPQRAVGWYEDALRVDPGAEDVCRSLM